MPVLPLIAAALLIAAGPLFAAPELTIQRIFDSPDLAGPTLRQAELSPAGDRVTFIRARDDDRDLLDLWEYHIGDDQTRILVAADAVVADEGELSAEEQARRERARIAGVRGIVEYRWSADGRFLIFPLAGDIYVLDLADEAMEVRQVTDNEAFDIDPQVAPDGRHVAFVRERNLWIADLETGQARALTEDGDEVVANGLAEFIAQEEMGRSTGFWWSPDSTRIAFLRTDESAIEPTLRHEIQADRITMVEQRYPFTGTPNVRYRLGVIDLDEDTTRWIDLGDEDDIYIPRVAWLPDGRLLSFQRQSRDQKTLELVIAEIEDGTTRTVLTDTSETWINLHDDLHFLSELPAFIWSSETDGFRHLYLYDLDGEPIRRLTAGPWVVDALKGVDEELGLVYFTGSQVSPEEKHLYRQSLVTQSPENITRVSRRPGWHQIGMDAAARVYVDTFSSTLQPPQLSLHSADGERTAWLLENRVTGDHPYADFRAGHLPTEFGSLVGPQEQQLRYRLIRPADFDPDRRYPVLVHVYGGPTHRLVADRWGRRALIDQYFARKGYVVFSLDNRGIVRQGKAFQDEIHLKLGRVEVVDQMVGLDWLRRQSFVDPERIAMFGWSYGGYVSLMALAQNPGQFAAGVAVAPVTDWALYDTHYTERYLGRPQDQAEAYREGNVLTWAGQLDDPLLLIHPMADDNVLFTHSTMLMQKLQEERIPFDLMTYPGEKHGIAGANQRVHVYEMIARFLHRHVKPETAQ
ncbi:MAG: S9 family peptidase [Wenzhouxiangella sp.]|nr:MAG: S9 family peptidase [Wenzhouxiangella sp.]